MTPDGSIASDRPAAISALLDAAEAPGAAVCLLVDGRPVLAEGISFADLARTRPLSADARFPLYSVAKIVLAVAALRLVEAGRLGLDAPIRASVPEVDLPEGVTLRRLLDHTAGLPDYGAMPDYNADLKADPTRPWTTDRFLARTLPLGLRFPPGKGWAYSNVGYLLVRLAIERVTGEALGEALAGLVFRPLGLQRTAVAASLADVRDVTPGWSAELDDDGGLHDVARRYHPGWVSHGLIVSTAPEVARIVDGLFGGRLLAPATLAQMLDAVDVPGDHPLIARPGYGLGLMVDRGAAVGPAAGHGGEGPGFSTAAWCATDAAGRRRTAVALANRDRFDLGLETAFALAGGEAAGPL